MTRTIKFEINKDSGKYVLIEKKAELIVIDINNSVLDGKELYEKLFKDYSYGDEIKFEEYKISADDKVQYPVALGLYTEIQEIVAEIQTEITEILRLEKEAIESITDLKEAPIDEKELLEV